MARPRKPLNLMLFDKKKHLTKKEIAQRKEAEIHIGDGDFICPDYVMENEYAFAKWNEVMKYLAKFPNMADLITSTDSDALAMYCQTYAEERLLIEMRAKAKTDKAKIKFGTQILKTREMHLKLARDLFLISISKVKNIPKQVPEKPENPLEKLGFGNV